MKIMTQHIMLINQTPEIAFHDLAYHINQFDSINFIQPLNQFDSLNFQTVQIIQITVKEFIYHKVLCL